MAIKHILVHLDHSPRSNSRLEFALGLADQQEAFLTGCYAAAEASVLARREQREPLRAKFAELAAASKVCSQWLDLGWEGNGQELVARICRTAQAADLVIVGQPDAKSNPVLPQDIPEKLVLHSGRPVLILPYAGQFNPRCERVMVAWNGGREAVRALHDALPLLQQAHQVNLLSLLPPGADESESVSSLTLICSHLDHHGIQAHPEMMACTDVSKGDILLNRCAEEGTGLLVAGGYYQGHLGNVARHLLKHMTVPVLMAH